MRRNWKPTWLANRSRPGSRLRSGPIATLFARSAPQAAPPPRGPCFPGFSPFVLSTRIHVSRSGSGVALSAEPVPGLPATRREWGLLSPLSPHSRPLLPLRLLLSAGIFGDPGGHPRDLEKLYFWKYRLQPRLPTPRFKEKSACYHSSCSGVRFQLPRFSPWPPSLSLGTHTGRLGGGSAVRVPRGGAASGPEKFEKGVGLILSAPTTRKE